MPEIAVNRTRMKNIASMSKETSPVLVTRILGNKKLSTDKRLLPVCPKTALGIRKIEKTNGNCKAFALHVNAKIYKSFDILSLSYEYNLQNHFTIL